MIAKQVMDASAALLNDTALSVFTYTAQIPYLNIALDELSEELMLNNVPVTNETATVISIPAGIEGIGGGNGNPNLPPGLIQPFNLYERTSGSTYSFLSMRHVEFLPVNQVPTAFLVYWSWEGDVIKFVPGGATGAIDIQLHYLKSIFGPIAIETDQINYNKAKNFLVYRNAALCAQYIGENQERAADLNGWAGLALNRSLGIATKGRQNLITRHRPFMASWRARRIIG
jgi:hypothetical protein